MIEGYDPYLCSVNINRDVDWVFASRWTDGWVYLGPCGPSRESSSH